MKKLFRFAIIALMSLALPNMAKAQKIAHLDYDSLLHIMPKYQKIIDSLTNYSASVQKTLMTMQQEYAFKSNELDSLRPHLPPLMIQLREKQLADMEQNYNAFSEAAQSQLEQIQVSLVGPLYEEIRKAIEAVAKEKGYKYVLDSTKGKDVLYTDGTDDIFEAVRIKLNVPKPAPKTTGTGAPQPPANGGK